MKYTMADVGVRVSPATMIDFLNDQRRGGYGYIHEYQMERYVRDLRVHRILEGTNEIMRVIIARKLLEAA